MRQSRASGLPSSVSHSQFIAFLKLSVQAETRKEKQPKPLKMPNQQCNRSEQTPDWQWKG
jgi:hypothetical protein